MYIAQNVFTSNIVTIPVVAGSRPPYQPASAASEGGANTLFCAGNKGR